MNQVAGVEGTYCFRSSDVLTPVVPCFLFQLALEFGIRVILFQTILNHVVHATNPCSICDESIILTLVSFGVVCLLEVSQNLLV